MVRLRMDKTYLHVTEVSDGSATPLTTVLFTLSLVDLDVNTNHLQFGRIFKEVTYLHCTRVDVLRCEEWIFVGGGGKGVERRERAASSRLP